MSKAKCIWILLGVFASGYEFARFLDGGIDVIFKSNWVLLLLSVGLLTNASRVFNAATRPNHD